MIPASGDNRSFHGTSGESAGPEAAVPLFASRILVSGENAGALVPRLKRSPRVSVYAISDAPADATTGLDRADAVIATDHTPIPFPAGFFDAALCELERLDLPAVSMLLEIVAPLVQQDGALILVSPARNFGQLPELLAARGWRVYNTWPLSSVHSQGPDRILLRAYRQTREPRTHARALYDAGNPAAAYDALYLLPAPLLAEPDEAAQIAADALHYLAAMPPAGTWPARLSRFARGHWMFSACATQDFHDCTPFHAMATLCSEAGLNLLGDRILATRDFVAGNAPATTAPVVPAPQEHRIQVSACPKRRDIRSVLFLTRSQVDYGLDTLYDGLCEVLGDASVVAYPYKPSLHDGTGPGARYYPAAFQRLGHRLTPEQIEGALREGVFDLILFGDCAHDIPRDLVCRLLGSARDVPVALLDQSDSPEDDLIPLWEFLNYPDILACFKREKLASAAYHPATVPMPFSYPTTKLPDSVSTRRDTDCFWSGNARPWLRETYLYALRERIGLHASPPMPQAAYRQQLLHARIAACFFGGGFDTVRYWEVPAHGSLLVAERPITEIPDNFEDGTHAVFFDTAGDLVEKIAYYLHHEEERAAIAAAGHGHLCERHTSAARARQLLHAANTRPLRSPALA